jgi:hypothetical protein
MRNENDEKTYHCQDDEHRYGRFRRARRKDEREERHWIAETLLERTKGAVTATDDQRSALDDEPDDRGHEQCVAPSADRAPPEVDKASAAADRDGDVEESKEFGASAERGPA